jgi:hypothetical protein
MPGMSEAASELESIARHLRRAGEVDLVRELQKAITGAARPVTGDIRAGLRDHMPDRYAETLDADLSLGTSSRLSGNNPGVSIYARARRKARKLRRLDAGLLTHPVYGHRDRWVTQASHVTRGFFTGPAEAAAPRVRAAIEAALTDVAEKAVRKGP